MKTKQHLFTGTRKGKDIFSDTVDALHDLLAREDERITIDRDPCASKKHQTVHFLDYLLCSLHGDTVLTIEGCRGDYGDRRSFGYVNAGSVVECIVKAILDHENRPDYVKAWQHDEVDAVQGCVEWEVKATLSHASQSTKPDGKRAVLLINQDGVSLIKKVDVFKHLHITSTKAYYDVKGLYGNRENFMVKYLEKMLGLEDGWSE